MRTSALLTAPFSEFSDLTISLYQFGSDDFPPSPTLVPHFPSRYPIFHRPPLSNYRRRNDQDSSTWEFVVSDADEFRTELEEVANLFRVDDERGKEILLST